MDKKQKYLTYQLQCLVLYYWTLDTPPREERWCWKAFGWHYLTVTSIGLDHGLWANTPALVWLVLFFKPSFPLCLFISLPLSSLSLSVHLIQQLYPSSLLYSPFRLSSLPFAKSLAFIAFHLHVDLLVSVGSASHLCVARLVHLHRPSSSRCHRWNKPFGAIQKIHHWLCSCMALYFCLLNIST